MLHKCRAGVGAPGSDIVRLQSEAAKGSDVGEVLRYIQRILNLCLRECGGLVFAQQTRALDAFVNGKG
jgi:hypothetical protein